MKGSPFQRNFNIGKTEAPNTESPYNKNSTPTKGLADIDLGRALGAGMATLPGGHDAYNPSGKKEYERDENGKLIKDADGNYIEKEQEENTAYTPKDLFGSIKNFLGGTKSAGSKIGKTIGGLGLKN
tara:strand:+ start:488 stop:868 length:381 start_codon:yes stop_codon:yes gene_type:complete